jgi:hypothetical protein
MIQVSRQGFCIVFCNESFRLIAAALFTYVLGRNANGLIDFQAAARGLRAARFQRIGGQYVETRTALRRIAIRPRSQSAAACAPGERCGRGARSFMKGR